EGKRAPKLFGLVRAVEHQRCHFPTPCARASPRATPRREPARDKEREREHPQSERLDRVAAVNHENTSNRAPRAVQARYARRQFQRKPSPCRNTLKRERNTPAEGATRPQRMQCARSALGWGVVGATLDRSSMPGAAGGR